MARGWARTLTDEQARTVQAFVGYDDRRKQARGKIGDWTVFMTPSTGPAKYVELRHYLSGGAVAKWVIERDGSVSAWNGGGSQRELVPFDGSVPVAA